MSQTNVRTYRVELEVSATHTYTIEDRDAPDEAGRSAERLFMEGESADDVGWPDIEIRRIVAVGGDEDDGPAIRLMRLYDFKTRGWKYVATDDATNKDLAEGPDRDSVIRRAWEQIDSLWLARGEQNHG